MIQQKDEEFFEDDGRGETFSGNQTNAYEIKTSPDIFVEEIEVGKSFEVFQGKLFYDQKPSGLSSSFGSNASLASRMCRLIEEYSLVKIEIDSLAAQSQKSSDSTIWSDLQSTAKYQIEDLEKLASQNNLQRPGVNNMEIYLKDEISKISSSNTSTLVMEETAAAVKSGQYFHHFTPQSLSDVSNLDKRIATIESSIGYPSSSSFSLQPLAKTVSRLDTQMSLLDAQVSDSLIQKIALLKTELSSILNSKSQREAKIVEGAVAIKDLHTKVNKLQDVSEELPIIVARFQMLDDIHRSSAGLISRVHNIEATTEKLSKTLAMNESVLTSLKSVCINILNLIYGFVLIYFCCTV